MQKLKIHWVTAEHDLVGNALGYNTHNSFMRKYCEQHFEFDESSNIALHIVPADHYCPIPNKFNILFTMWEALDIPTSYVLALNQADLIITPSKFCKDLFKPYTNKPIEVCYEGVEAHLFPYYDRITPMFGQKFRYLWIGAPNPRKGYLSLLKILPAIEQNPNVELYIKTTAPKFDRKSFISDLWKKRRELRRLEREGSISENQTVKGMLRFSKNNINELIVNQYYEKGNFKNVIWDSRKLSIEDLVSLYNSAHCFIFPTLGEGWGLTLCEAMATGCPCIATPITGCADFFDEEVGYSIRYKQIETYLQNYDVRAGIYIPDSNDLFKQMLFVYRNYNKALDKGKKGSERIHSRFTWELSAKRLKDIIENYCVQEEALELVTA